MKVACRRFKRPRRPFSNLVSSDAGAPRNPGPAVSEQGLSGHAVREFEDGV